MKIRILIKIILFSLTSSVLVEGKEEYLNHIAPYGKEKETLSIHQKELKGEDNLRAHLVDSFSHELDSQREKLNPSYHISSFASPQNIKRITWKEKILGIEGHLGASKTDSSKQIELRNKKILREIYNKGERFFSFSYIRDNYEVTDHGDIFHKTFIDNPEGSAFGSLHLGSDHYLYRGSISFLYSIFLGFGHYSGRGLFSNGLFSERTKFFLRTVPLDLHLSVELPVGRFLSLQGGGGPSFMALFQSRTDRGHEDSDKHRRQWSRGQSALGRLKISLAPIFKKAALNMFRDYNITNYYLNLECRYQSYSSFQDEISISGLSFGAGFSFDYF